MALNMTNFDAALKELYAGDALKNLTYQKHPFLSMVPKSERFFGDQMVIPVTYGNPQGRSATIGTAITNKGNSSLTKFVVTRVKDYSVASIDNETILASSSNEGAFIDALKYEVDNAANELSNSIAKGLFGNLGGALGQVGSVGGTVLTLKSIDDIVNFEVGMEIVSAETDGTSGSVQTGSATITRVDRSAGQLTTDSNWTTQMSALDADDYLFQQGDFGLKISGLAGWIPNTTPTATTFFGVNRALDPVRLGGLRVPSSGTNGVTGLPIEEKIQTALSRLAREGGQPDTVLMNHADFLDLEISLGSKAVYDSVPSGGEVGWKSIKVHGPAGPCKVVADRFCPRNRIYCLQMNTWKLASIGPAVRMLDRDGKVLRESTSDAYEVRLGSYLNLTCNAPGWNAVIDNS